MFLWMLTLKLILFIPLTSNILLYFPLAGFASDHMWMTILTLVLLHVEGYPPLGIFPAFSHGLFFRTFSVMIYLGVGFSNYLFYLIFSELSGLWRFLLILEIFSHYYFKYFFYCILFLLNMDFNYVLLQLLKLSHGSWMACAIFISFPPCISVWEVSNDLFSNSCLWLCPVYWWAHQRHSSFLSLCFFISYVFFWFFLTISISDVLLICSYIVSTFSLFI